MEIHPLPQENMFVGCLPVCPLDSLPIVLYPALCFGPVWTLSWVWPLGNTSRRMETVERVAWGSGMPAPLDGRSQILLRSPLHLQFPESSPAPRLLRSGGTNGAPLFSALEYCTRPAASLHPVYSTKSTPFIIQVSRRILMKVRHLFCDGILADTIRNA